MIVSFLAQCVGVLLSSHRLDFIVDLIRFVESIVGRTVLAVHVLDVGHDAYGVCNPIDLDFFCVLKSVLGLGVCPEPSKVSSSPDPFRLSSTMMMQDE